MAYLETQDGEILEKVELTTTQPCRDKLKWFTVNGTCWYCEKVKTRGWNQITGRPNIQKRYNDTKQVTDCPHTWKRNYSNVTSAAFVTLMICARIKKSRRAHIQTDLVS